MMMGGIKDEKRILASLICLCMLVSLLPAALAVEPTAQETVVFYINEVTGNDSKGTGTAEKPFATIQNALSKAETGKTYKIVLQSSITLSSKLLIDSDSFKGEYFTIEGQYNTLTCNNTDKQYGLFICKNGTLDNLKIISNRPTAIQVGTDAPGAEVTMNQCTIEHSPVGVREGVGVAQTIRVESGSACQPSLIMNECTITTNQATGTGSGNTHAIGMSCPNNSKSATVAINKSTVTANGGTVALSAGIPGSVVTVTKGSELNALEWKAVTVFDNQNITFDNSDVTGWGSVVFSGAGSNAARS